MIARIGVLLATVVVGLVIGLVGGFVQAQRAVLTMPWGPMALPWGALLAVVTLLLGIRAAMWATQTKAAGWLVLAGWVLGTALLAIESSSGDLAIGCAPGESCLRQWGYLLASPVLGAAVASFPMLGGVSLTIDKSDASDTSTT